MSGFADLAGDEGFDAVLLPNQLSQVSLTLNDRVKADAAVNLQATQQTEALLIGIVQQDLQAYKGTVAAADAFGNITGQMEPVQSVGVGLQRQKGSVRRQLPWIGACIDQVGAFMIRRTLGKLHIND